MYRGQAIAARTRYLKEVEYRAAGRNRDATVLESNGAQQPTIAVSLAEAKGKTSQGCFPRTVPVLKATQMVRGLAHAIE